MKINSYFLIIVILIILFNVPPGQSTVYVLYENSYQTDSDSTIYDTPDVTAQLSDAINYFLKNNKYKDWKEVDKKIVAISGVVEKDGSITNVTIKRSSGVDVLDKEAVRLIKAAKYDPAKYKDNIVRSKFSIIVHFPAKKQ